MTDMTAEQRAEYIFFELTQNMSRHQKDSGTKVRWTRDQIRQAEATARQKALEEVIAVMHANSFFGSTPLISKMMGKNDGNCDALLLSDIVSDVRQKALEEAANHLVNSAAGFHCPSKELLGHFKLAEDHIRALMENPRANRKIGLEEQQWLRSRKSPR